ncbi:sulfite exporter TauE/SafE family protein [Acetobacter sacchari]|uniref:Probable membrane transporter protein n=1 Tax=Acetobacter sacchari TaxID=2661687 RepID=A0ABS3LXD0_9PROT|nr:sulfite exporter TauE/SafE family protein [Acetobacter sacchari]MBO1360577.1 sulfite exporter TauE/SafE family protein [Acetobacter sacchari]
MDSVILHAAIEIACGTLVGFTLGLIGGGGSILAVPLMVYVVGVANPHVAIGTSAFAVAVNALAGLTHHARSGVVQWRCAGLFAGCGVAGALLGATIGKAVDGQRLLLCFALLMIVVGVLMLRGRKRVACAGGGFTWAAAPKVMGCGLGAGVLSGFFGIGGGFLIVPALIAATGMPILNAIGTSLVAVSVFGFSTAASYLASGLIDWRLAGLFILGGVAGSFVGTRAARSMAGKTGLLSTLFACVIFLVATYMIWRSV